MVSVINSGQCVTQSISVGQYSGSDTTTTSTTLLPSLHLACDRAVVNSDAPTGFFTLY